MDGILNINKPVGITSHTVVARTRRLLHQQRVGHAGTLDPLAAGVLPICLGQATRVAEYLSESGKAYRAELVLGVVTDTYDREGQVVARQAVPPFTREQLEAVLQSFVGPQLQVPPPYSALKVQGQPAYKRARAGEAVKLAARPVVIERLALLAWESPRLLLEIECSKGTYVRSLAHDLGQRLGCGAHLAALVRTRSGPFGLEESITLEQLAAAVADGTVERYLAPPDVALQQYPAIVAEGAALRRVLHGNSFRGEPPPAATVTSLEPLQARVYDPDGRLLAIAVWEPKSGCWRPTRVLLPAPNG
jgi:tRNA pseudouridine55 synthase